MRKQALTKMYTQRSVFMFTAFLVVKGTLPSGEDLLSIREIEDGTRTDNS
jgi:DNA-binding transcriptional regulator YhcF (GntR family)